MPTHGANSGLCSWSSKPRAGDELGIVPISDATFELVGATGKAFYLDDDGEWTLDLAATTSQGYSLALTLALTLTLTLTLALALALALAPRRATPSPRGFAGTGTRQTGGGIRGFRLLAVGARLKGLARRSRAPSRIRLSFTTHPLRPHASNAKARLACLPWTRVRPAW